MHTPEQARALWCPMVRVARREEVLPGLLSEGYAVVAGCNSDALCGTRVPASCRCIADQCAMWRWVREEDHDGHARRGYCGMAGMPA